MSETPNPSPEQARTAVTAEEFISWHQRIADELDVEAMRLQMQVEDNPEIVNDPDYKIARERLEAQQELLTRAGDDFSNHTGSKQAEYLLHRLFDDEEQS